MKAHLKIKQMMPIPAGMEPMVRFGRQGEQEEMKSASAVGIPCCLVLVDGEDVCDDFIAPYRLDCEIECVQDICDTILVNTRYCPDCGGRTVPHMHGVDESTLYYTCGCGYSSENKEDKIND